MRICLAQDVRFSCMKINVALSPNMFSCMKINVALSPAHIFKCENLCRQGPATSKVDFETENNCLAFLHKRAGPGSQDNPIKETKSGINIKFLNLRPQFSELTHTPTFQRAEQFPELFLKFFIPPEKPERKCGLPKLRTVLRNSLYQSENLENARGIQLV